MQTKEDNSFKAFKILANNAILQGYMYFFIVTALITIQVMALLSLIFFLNDTVQITQTYQYYIAMFWATRFPQHEVSFTIEPSRTLSLPAYVVADLPALKTIKDGLLARMKWEFYASFLVYPVFGWLFLRLFKKIGHQILGNKWLRGGKLRTEKELAGILQNEHPCRIFVSKHVRIPIAKETHDIFVIGQKGAGKSVAITSMVKQILAENIGRTVIFDTKGDYTTRFYNPKTCILFDPFHDDCPGWSIFNEIDHGTHIPMIGASLIPDTAQQTSTGSGQFFRRTARDLFMAYLSILARGGPAVRTNSELLRVMSLPFSELATEFNETEHGRVALRELGDAEKSGQRDGILGTLGEYTSWLQYVKNSNGQFSFRKWLNGTGHLAEKKCLILRYAPNMEEAMKPMLSLAIDLMVKELGSMDDDLNRRVPFILDEFGKLNPLPSVVDLLTGGRSKGSMVVIGIQDFGRLDELYGEPIRKTLFNNCYTKMVLRMGDPQTAEYLSTYIGDEEILEVNEGYTGGIGPTHMRDGIQTSEGRTSRRLVLKEEIMRLSELHGYLVVGQYPAAMVEIPLLKDG